MLLFMILPLYASIEKLNYQLVEAARDLGAGFVATFTKVIIPLTLPGIVAGCVMVFMPTIGLFYVASLLGGSRQLLVGNLKNNSTIFPSAEIIASGEFQNDVGPALEIYQKYWGKLRTGN